MIKKRGLFNPNICVVLEMLKGTSSYFAFSFILLIHFLCSRKFGVEYSFSLAYVSHGSEYYTRETSTFTHREESPTHTSLVHLYLTLLHLNAMLHVELSCFLNILSNQEGIVVVVSPARPRQTPTSWKSL